MHGKTSLIHHANQGVFAGLRNDPFFFELNGFRNAVAAIEAAMTVIPASG